MPWSIPAPYARVMTDLSTIASLGTAVGTLVLGAATFSSVRSSNRAARIAEQSFQVGVRPLLVQTRFEDRAEKIMFIDQHWVKVEAGRAVVECTEEVIYLATSVRNAGKGIAVLHSWQLTPERLSGGEQPALDGFRPLSRDLYIPDGDQGFWQGAIRGIDDPLRKPVIEAVDRGEGMTLELLYGDHEGGQRAITRFNIVPDGDNQWLVSVSKHWNVDREDPR
jgi:hypothetical protein